MRVLARWAARFYPKAWRARYAEEFEALLEDVGLGAGDLWDIARGALFMRMTSITFWKIVAGCALAGALAAGIVAATLPDRYVSTAVIHIKPVLQSGASGADVLHNLQQMQQATLSRSSLSSIIQRLGIYANERKKLPLEDVIQEMRNRDLRIRPTNVRGERAFAVEFANENPAAAQATVHAIVSSPIEQNLQMSQRPGNGATVMEVLDPASLPSRPVSPNRVKAMINGLLTGLLAGLLCGAIFSIVRRNERWSIKRIGGFAGAGMLLGLTVAFLIPDEYVSSAVLRTADGGKLQSTITEVLSDDSLAAVVRQENLFSRELSSGSMNDVVRNMRNEYIRLQMVHVARGHLEGTAAFVISFRCSDRFTAQRVTSDLVMRFLSLRSATAVLDPASDPVAPSSPNRLGIAGFGTVAGILLGLAASRFKRPDLATA